jgi:fido (protein-threonine AMPylation protein)
VINQSFQTAQPSVQEYGPASRETSGIPVYQAPLRSAEEVEAAAAQASQPYYLIAFKDHSVYSAIAYWVEGETLHYFTSGNTHNQVSMGLVDKELTDRLNRERKVDIRLK